MAPPSWAFQAENFSTKPDDELICSICQCVFCSPVYCPCNHVFCQNCIVKWLSDHISCPICRKRAYESQLHPVLPMINNMIMKIALNCRNLNVGCNAQLTIENCELHMNECLFESEECSNGCGNQIIRKDMLKHKFEDCPFRSIECNECGLKIYGDATSHNCIESLKLIIKEREKKEQDLQKEVRELQKKVRELSKSLNCGATTQPQGLASSAMELRRRRVSSPRYFSTNSTFSSFGETVTSSSFDASNDSNENLAGSRFSDVMESSSSDSSDSYSYAGDIDYFRGLFSGRLSNIMTSLSSSSSSPTSSSSSSTESNSSDDQPQVTTDNKPTVALLDSPIPSGRDSEKSVSSGTVARPPKRHLLIAYSEERNSRKRKTQKYSSNTKKVETKGQPSHSEQKSATASVQAEENPTPSTSGSYSDKQNVTKRSLNKKKIASKYSGKVRRSSKSFPSTKGSMASVSQVKNEQGLESMDSPLDTPEQLQQRRVFERTLSLLESECETTSDPDYIPDEDMYESNSSDASSFDSLSMLPAAAEIDSDSSYEVKVPPTTYELLERYCKYDSEEDPDYFP